MDTAAARKQCEAAAIMIDDEVVRLVARYSPAAAESIATLVATLAAALEALEEAQETQRLADEAIGHASIALGERAREVELLKRERDEA
ncbi:hypothetical protein LCGC14_2421610, partial [marine sediment metagenome]